MVCVAAFIILCLISVVVGFLSIFKRDIGAKWWKVFKKAWHCVFKKVRLQKCDTNFKDDVKNTILKKVILKRPKWVKPISVTIEILSVLIVLITIWSIVIAIKSLLALWVFGTCNVSQPSQCSLGAEVCSIDQAEPNNIFEKLGRSFGEWGEIFSHIPDRLKTWHADDFDTTTVATLGNPSGSPVLEIIDPGCSVCMQSYRNIKNDQAFLDSHYVKFTPYPIELADGTYKFKNSDLLTRYLYATALVHAAPLSHVEGVTVSAPVSSDGYSSRLLDRLFTEHDAEGVNYQTVFNDQLSTDEAEALLKSWLKSWGASDEEVKEISTLAHSEQVDHILARIKKIVEQEINAKGIPLMLVDGRKVSGLFHSSD